MIRIGFLDRSDAGWTAGASYSRSMVHALAGTGRCVIKVLTGPESRLSGLPAEAEVLRAAEPLAPVVVRELVKAHDLDVLLPVTKVLLPDTPGALVGWIPDFQHRHLPGYFTAEQRRQRDVHFGYLATNCDGMMFSSESALADFRAFYPAFEGVSASVHFPSSFAYEPGLVATDPTPVLEKYGLPPSFVLVANQFWKHKNHRLVLEAVARSRRERPEVRVVMVGMLSDSRDVTHPHLSELVRRLSVERLFENVSVLGEVPFADLVALLRCAREVVQPSEFEGWNSTVEDALALGKPVACSDIPTHREQAPGAFFFPPDDAAPLAAHLAALDWSGPGWAGGETELGSLEAERRRGGEWAAGLVEFCERAAALHRAGSRVRVKAEASLDQARENPFTHIKYLETQNERLTRAREQAQGQIDRAAAQVEKMKARAAELEQKLASARADAKASHEKYWREKSRPLRARLGEEIRRRLGALGRS